MSEERLAQLERRLEGMHAGPGAQRRRASAAVLPVDGVGAVRIRLPPIAKDTKDAKDTKEN